MLMGHLQVSSNLHDPMGRARFPGEAQTGKLTGKLTKMWAAVPENGDFLHCGSNNLETIEYR